MTVRLRMGSIVLLAIVLFAAPVAAVMDIENDGPMLRAGRFAMRVTNIGVVGNAFFDAGLSFDPSFEYPIHSGQELLNQAELWVGALDPFGHTNPRWGARRAGLW